MESKSKEVRIYSYKGDPNPVIMPPPGPSNPVYKPLAWKYLAASMLLTIAVVTGGFMWYDSIQPPDPVCTEYHIEQQNRMRFYGGTTWMPVVVDVKVCDIWATVTPIN